MRHLSIIIIFGALLLQGCDRHKPTKVSKNIQMPQRQEAIIPEEAPVVAPAVVAAPVPAHHRAKKEVVKRKPAEVVPAPILYEQEDIFIQAEETRWPKNRGKTYNELQMSDDLDDYPFTPSTNEYNFNDRQAE